jgi:hypothetical protein
MTIQPIPVPAKSQVIIKNKPNVLKDVIIAIFVTLLVLYGLVRAAIALSIMAYLFAAVAVLIFSVNLLMIFQRRSMVLVLGSLLATAAIFGIVFDSVTRVLLILFIISVELLMLTFSRARRS